MVYFSVSSPPLFLSQKSHSRIQFPSCFPSSRKFTMMSLRKSRSKGIEKVVSLEDQHARINEVWRLIKPWSDRLPNFCSDASITRYLRARNWNPEKASKMLKETLKWRLDYKPEAIKWEDIAHEAETGKIYRADYCDKYGRPVLVMRPGFQNSNSTTGQIKYLVYCMENAILNLPPEQEQMVWLIDFQGWTMGCVSVKVTRETAHVLQDYYPERLALGILYNPPRIFESFWKIVKPFLEHKTYKKVKFVYSDNVESQKVMTDTFDMETLECAFGGSNPAGFDSKQYAERMKEDDKKFSDPNLPEQSLELVDIHQRSDSSVSGGHSEAASETSAASHVSSPNSADINIVEGEMKRTQVCEPHGSRSP